MMKEENFTVSVYTENNLGLLSRIASVFLKRHINIESITASKSEVDQVMRFTVIVRVREDQIRKIIGQLEKQIDVIKAFYHRSADLFSQETALYKVQPAVLMQDFNIQDFIRESNARIVKFSPDYCVIEKTGNREETDDLYERLKPYGLMQFVRSGTIAVSTTEMPIRGLLEKFNTKN